jgi:hypothetical protein
MCNCGKKRTELKQQPRDFSTIIQNKMQPVAQKKETVLFKYTGNTGLTITGSVTRKNYRFSFPGDVQPVELSDASGMNNIPVLKRV